MRAGRIVCGARAGLSFAVAGLLAMTGAGARPACAAQPAAQTIAQRHAEALAYLAAHADSEDMTMIPMRDGVRLYSLVLFPRGQPRQNLPAVLLRNPYLTKGMVERVRRVRREPAAARLRGGVSERAWPVLLRGDVHLSRGLRQRRLRHRCSGWRRSRGPMGRSGRWGVRRAPEEQHKLQGTHPRRWPRRCRWDRAPGSGMSARTTRWATGIAAARSECFGSVVLQRRLQYRPALFAESDAGPAPPTRAVLGPRARAHSAVGHRHPDLHPADQRDHGRDGWRAERSQ